MKKFFLLVAIIMMASCVKNTKIETPKQEQQKQEQCFLASGMYISIATLIKHDCQYDLKKEIYGVPINVPQNKIECGRVRFPTTGKDGEKIVMIMNISNTEMSGKMIIVMQDCAALYDVVFIRVKQQ